MYRPADFLSCSRTTLEGYSVIRYRHQWTDLGSRGSSLAPSQNERRGSKMINKLKNRKKGNRNWKDGGRGGEGRRRKETNRCSAIWACDIISLFESRQTLLRNCLFSCSSTGEHVVLWDRLAFFGTLRICMTFKHFRSSETTSFPGFSRTSIPGRYPGNDAGVNDERK